MKGDTYLDLMKRSEKATVRAINCKDDKLSNFYYHAAQGYAIKASKMTLKQAGAK